MPLIAPFAMTRRFAPRWFQTSARQKVREIATSGRTGLPTVALVR